MSKLLLFSLTSLLSLSFTGVSLAQEFAIEGGVTYSDVIMDLEYEGDENYTPESKPKPGFYAGFTSVHQIQGDLLLKTGLGYYQKGYEWDLEKAYGAAEEIDGYARVNMNYLVIPVNLAYNAEPLRIFAGPYLGLGIPGKREFDFTLTYAGSEEEIEETVDLYPAYGTMNYDDLGEDEDAFNGIDIGWNAGLGLHFGSVGLNASVSQGLSNIIPQFEYEDGEDNSEFREDNSIKNMVYKLSIIVKVSTID